MKTAFDPELIERAILLARELQERASALQTPAERRQQAELDRMLQVPEDKATLVQLTDRAFRAHAPERVAEQFTHILDVQGVPRFFSPLDRALLRGFQTFGGWLPGVSVPLVKDHMQHETANVVLPAEPEVLHEHLQARQEEGVRMNVNFLGEALLGEEEAQRRMRGYLDALKSPDIECLSVKISTIYSQISAMARAHTIRVLCDRLEPLYRAAAGATFQREGRSVPKFLYLDMEEYRDMRLTAEAFMRTLERPGLEKVSAGIALQAYIPDSARVLRELTAWAHQRIAKGGGPITVRIVKGANMEMERVEASLRGWPQAPFKTKAETDANYKRLLTEAITPQNLAAVHIGVASHNLFDLAYGLVLADVAKAGDRVQFEMLEGMANHQRRALFERSRNLLLYAPACRKEDFLNAIGYLIRRLDENTGPDNFLRHAFRLHVGTEEWNALERGFREAFHLGISDAPRRTQNRTVPHNETAREEAPWMELVNEPDTDFALPQNSDWAEQIVHAEGPRSVEIQNRDGALTEQLPPNESLPRIPLVLGGETIRNRETRPCLDPSRPGVTLCDYALATDDDVDRAVAAAHADVTGWRSLSHQARSAILGTVAAELRKARGALMWAALANGGKTLTESDPEVSEAIDFLEFYRASAREFFELPTLEARALGVVVVVPPWNFPIAIPCGGMAAALAAGNTVILKPASDTVLVAWELCQCFWRGGVPREVLQFVPCPGSGAGQRLVTHPHVDAVILTGGTATALHLLQARPDLRLFAETGGKNATIVTALADREQAIKHVLHSAFSHSGQKCSATSLLLLEAEVYDDPAFQRMLVDAVRSLHVGSAWDLETKIGPLIRPPAGELARALTALEPGESWAVEPLQVGDNPHLWSPGVKWDVQPGSITHHTEFFGPLLGVIRFTKLSEAISLVNATGYGLTSGLESLDEREQAEWRDGIRAGNLYINRGTTGAIVLRQPFGGVGKSSFGPGMKAGGPNYVAQFQSFTERQTATNNRLVQQPRLRDLQERLLAVEIDAPASEVTGVLAAISNYDRWMREEFGQAHDHFRLIGEDNLRRYQPLHEMRIRVHPADTVFDIFARACAAQTVGCRALISTPPDLNSKTVQILDDFTDAWGATIEFLRETDEQLSSAIRGGEVERARFAAPDRVPIVVRAAAAEAFVHLADTPVLAEGRVELLWYLREQSVSDDYHRYGNLGARSEERRVEPL
ncbi:Aldehyde Dehydrogenase [Chthoniobacter flavus Ellin428]|uniref:L-glutamate gamma-semialdehyde dehydrogenase n=1 Tax=Chthoniobacter flavus Ellin428 TaxID=497964 RepID=B4D5A4_9BACT|nr:proline dehydrogenase family protein [Chthoniobacter flavus]EDY18309.1 Aldehyde Dehydrogenase [Chthoniobacter flavus Ellin428]TCO91335.1 L-proline dehydrogenase [Chthoniobacter flavus]